MVSGKRMFLLACTLVLSLLAACGGSTGPVASTATAVTAKQAGSATAAPTATATAGTQKPTATQVTVPTATAAAATKTPAGSDQTAVQTWDSAGTVRISLNGKSIAVDGKGATVTGSRVTITSAGTYVLSGSLADGQILVDTADKGTVQLVLNGADISSATSAPIYVVNAKQAVIVLADKTTNTVTDGASYVLDAAAGDEPNAAIFSKADLTIGGGGSLTVTGNYNDGIASKDKLAITGGAITVNAADDGIRGKDSVTIKDGIITVKAKGDGIKSDNDTDATKGNITIEGGVVNVTSGGDAITAQTDVTVSAGKIVISSGGGSGKTIADTLSAKGIKGVASVHINGGTFTIDSADDALHSNRALVIQAGTFAISTGDDAVHADATIEINGGDIRVTKCYEGIESAIITINGGTIHLVSSDDGLNVAAGRDASGTNAAPGQRAPAGRGPRQDVFASSGAYHLYINGGYIYVDALGDGLDINGGVDMTNGVLIVNGPTRNDNGALDYDAGFKMTGGLLIAAGSSGMAQAPDTSSTQYQLLMNLTSAVKAGTLVQIQTSKGDAVLTFAPTKQYQSIAFSSAALTKGTTYDVYFGGSSTGTATDGLYQGGKYASGIKSGSFTISSIVTKVGSGR